MAAVSNTWIGEGQNFEKAYKCKDKILLSH